MSDPSSWSGPGSAAGRECAPGAVWSARRPEGKLGGERESWGARARLGVALAPGSCGQTCWQPVGRGKGRSSKRAFPARGPTPYAESGCGGREGAGARPGAEGLRGAHTALQTDRRKPARAPAGPREPRAPRPFSPTLASGWLPEVQNIYKVCSAPQAWIPGASGGPAPERNGTAAPGSGSRSGSARAGGERVCVRLPSPRRNPRPSATVLGIDGSISAF